MLSTGTASKPLFEDDEFDLEVWLSQFDDETRKFVRSLRDTGGAKLQLSGEALALIDQAVAETEPLFTRGERLQDAWRSSPAIRALATLPDLQEKLAAAYGRAPFPFQTLNFRRGTEQELHTDVVHFSSIPERFMCGVWIALEDISEDSGPLRYYPGSHRLPFLTMREAGVTSKAPTEADYHEVWAPKFERLVQASGLPEQALILKKGEAFFWAANLAHGGHPITDSNSTRRSLVVHFYFDDCVYYAGRYGDAGEPQAIRLPVDIAIGRWRWPSRDGKREKVSKRVLARSLARDIIRGAKAMVRPT
jgi:hypothetical protein